MLKFTPILLAILYAVIQMRFSIWASARDLDAKSRELSDAALHPLLDRMAAALDIARVKVLLYDIDPVNAMAMADGRIVVTRGMYDLYRQGKFDAEELASVIAHELGHVALGHARQRQVLFAGQNALRAGLLMTIGRLAPGIAGAIINAAMMAISKRLSRANEYEADAYAAALLSKVGIGHRPFVTMLGKTDALNGGGGRTPAWLLSHPVTEDRIKAVEKLAAHWQPSTLSR